MKVFQCILKSIETILIQNYFYSNAKKYKQDKKKKKKKKKKGTNFDLTTDSYI